MKFNVYLPEETKTYLEQQYKEYLKIRPMTKKEQRAVREWVKDGNSVYENPAGIWQDGMVMMEYLDTYRDEEYIRQQTKGMSPEETRKYGTAYYGLKDRTENEYDLLLDEMGGIPFV